MGIENYDDDELIEALANRGIDVRTIKEFSMVEINDEIVRRRMEAERKEIALRENGVDDYNRMTGQNIKVKE